ncbi:MAG: hypothetical protein E6Q43_05465 [Dokdonella sp.]|nr:MAG: hypothetical protein EYC71_10630 [Gammaproteobacteria bacterium]TXI73376.1 MAG: hypothetical protein E6Q43_05465 [Dokdonella sp.]
MTPEPIWIPLAEGRLFGVLHMPDTPPRGSILICPPFFHEHVRSQRLFALLADALCGHGFAVLRFDYLGSGDSEGADETFSMRGAERDALAAANWLGERAGRVRLVALGIRAGAHPAAAVFRQGKAGRLWLWQPILHGGAYLEQLRERAHLERQSSERYARPVADLAEDLATVMGFPCGVGLHDELAHAVLVLNDLDASHLLILDAAAASESASASGLMTLEEPLAGWADQLDMARIGLPPIRAIAARLADAGAVP